MAPSQPAQSRSSSRTSHFADATEGTTAQQAGLSPTTLNAGASAQSLRQAIRPGGHSGPSRSSSTPNLLLKKSRPSTDVGSMPELAPPQRKLHSAVVRQPSPRVPAVSSPLNPTSSHRSSEHSISRDGSEDAGEGSRGSSGSIPQIQRSLAPPTARRQPLRQPEMFQGESTASLTRQNTPRSVRDLGSDYTRYFNPFATRNNSQQDLNTPLPRTNSQTYLAANNAVSSEDLTKRLSDPFGDTKRISNPFESAHNSAPGTPIPRTNSKEEEKEKKIPNNAAAAAGIAGASTPAFIRGADPEKAAFFPWMDDRLGAPEYAFPLYTDEKEEDDDMHMPQWDDDVKLKARWQDHFTRENVASTFGLFFMVVGLLCIFVVLPVISYTGTGLIDFSYDTPLDQMGGPWAPEQAWAHVNDRAYPLMKNLRTGLIDPDTPDSAKTRKDINGNTLNLVFSDEFNTQNRTFYPGDDPFWFAPDMWYGATQNLEWYDPDAVNTGDGTLQLQLDQFPNHGLNFRSGMLNSWNQLCFKGGVFEIAASLPGPGGVHGLWPGAWTMGNLGRPGYLATTDGMWPYTYSSCDTGITPNQSMTDGTSNLPGQRLPSCPCTGEDHPTPGNGRGAPEIDIVEVSGDWGGMGIAVATQSYQVAPFDIFHYPNYDFMETPNYKLSFVNPYTGGPYQQAISTTTMLNNEWYDGKSYQKYAFEYAPGGDENAYIQWYVGDDEMMRFDARAIGPNGNIGQRLVSEEPMSMVLNLGMSHTWVDIQFPKLRFPTVMRIDYVRWYQKDGEEMVTCDPPGYETTEYIANHPVAYNNLNCTHWADAGYSRPKNTLMDGCSA